MKKVFLWILGVLIALMLAGYTLLFTPFGNNLLKPMLQSRIDSLVPIRLEITEFTLSFRDIHLTLQNGEYIDIVLKGDFWLPSQEFNLTLNAIVRDMSLFGELVDTPLQGGFRLEAHSGGTLSNFEIHAKSDIAKSFSTLHMRFANRHLQNMDAQIKEANIQEILAMFGHKPYIKGLLNVDAKFLERDSKLEGEAAAVVSNGAFDTNALSKNFGITLEDSAFKASLHSQTQEAQIAHTFEFAAPIGTIHAQGTTPLPHELNLSALRTLPIEANFGLNLLNLAPFSPLVGRAIRGNVQSSGNVKGVGLGTLEIQGQSNIAHSQTRYNIAMEDFSPMNFEIHTKDAALEQLLWMLHLPAYANATLNAQVSKLDSNTDLNIQASGTLNTDVNLKECGIALPRTPLTLTLSGTLTDKQGKGEMKLHSEALQLEAQPIVLRDHILHTPYTLRIKDASKLAIASGIKLAGALDLAGDLEFDKILSLSFSTRSLGGEVRGNYRDYQLSAQLDSLSSDRFLAFFGIPPILQAPLSGTLSYDTLATSGTLTLSGKEGKLAPNKLSSDAMQILGVDMTKETYHTITLNALLDDALLNAEFKLDSPNTHLSSQKTRLDLHSRRIDSVLALRIGQSEANVWLTDEIAKPNVRLELKKLIIKGDQIFKGLEGILGKQK